MFKKNIIKIFALVLVLIFIFSFSINTNVAVAADSYSNSYLQTQDVDTNIYYYNQLNETEKIVYNSFMNSQNKFLNNESFSFDISEYKTMNDYLKQAYINSVQRARLAFTFDNPKEAILFQNVKLSMSFNNNYVTVTCRPNSSTNQYTDFSSNREIPNALATLENQAIAFVRTLRGTDAQKLYQIYEWLSNRCVYDSQLTLVNNTENAYGAIINRRAVCSGFAYAYKYLADLAGLKVIYVVGWTNNNVYHAWNMAYIDGKWYQIDATGGSSAAKSNNDINVYFMMDSNYQSNYTFDRRSFLI